MTQLSLRIVLAAGQNAFFVELADSLVAEFQALGTDAQVVTGAMPEPRDGLICIVLAPHEYYELRRGQAEPTRLDLHRTMFICLEQPGTGHFEQNAGLSGWAGEVFDISPLGTRKLRQRGVTRALHLQMGWTASWDRIDPLPARDIDVAFLGCVTPRREEILASLAPRLRKHRSWLVVSDNSRPNPPGTPGFLDTQARTELLSRTRILLNVHQSEIAYGEHLRLVQAASAGCVVVTEPSIGLGPFVPGRHLVAARAEQLGDAIDALLADETWRRKIAHAARELVRAEHPLSHAASTLILAAARLDKRHPMPSASAAIPVRRPRRLTREVERPDWEVPVPSAMDVLLIEAQDQRIRTIEDRRARERAAVADRPATAIVLKTPGWRALSTARVSVLVPLYRQGAFVEEALDSLLMTPEARRGEVEVIVIDDNSPDDCADVVARWTSRHPDFPLCMVHHAANEGLPRARNTALAFARGETCLALDADNTIEPRGLTWLLEVLDADPGATFSYGLLMRFSSQGPIGTQSHLEWQPQRLQWENYIDALALLRTETLREIGGWHTGPGIYAWEDYDLWCTIAERGDYGIHVKQFVARYRDEASFSMRSILTSGHAHVARIASRHPRVFSGRTEWPPAA